MYLKKEIDSENFQITYAKKGVFEERSNIPILVLHDGETITGKKNEITNFSFSKSDFALNSFETNTTTYKKTQELSTLSLFRCISKIYDTKNVNKIIFNIENCSYQNKNNIYKEIYKRTIIPLYIPLLMLLPLLLIISSKESLNYSKLKLSTFFGLFLIIFSETTIRLISEILLKNLGISILPILIFLILYFLFLKKFKLDFIK